MNALLSFEIFRGPDVLARVDGVAETAGAAIALDEGDRVAFELSPKMPGREYQVRIGDELYPPTIIGRKSVEWSDRDYFDSARGPTRLSLLERLEDSDEPWCERFVCEFWITPGKINDAAFERMTADLSRLSSGLLFDLLAKSTIKIAPRSASGGPSIAAQSAQAELRLLESVWDELARALTLVLQQPEMHLRRSIEQRPCVGTEPLSHNEFARLASIGIDLRRRETPRPFSANVLVTKASADTLENRVIVAFLHLLAARLRECLKRARLEVTLMAERRRFWSAAGAAEGVADFEQPRRERLQQAGDVAETILARLRLATRAFSRVGAYNLTRGVPDTPVFRNVAAYHRIWRIMRRYLSESAVTVDTGPEERLKQTWRMYEQWVFLQIAGALRESGLQCVNQEDFVAELSRHRFTVDLQRDARLVFTADQGERIVLTYEPTIYPKPIAQHAGGSVYLGASSTKPWSPDVLVEIFRPSAAGPLTLTYAVVVDAKYTRNPTRRLEDCLKYLKIRSTETDGAVVRQIWVAAPNDSGIVPDDAAITWSDTGPMIALGELVWGVLGLQPNARMETDAVGRVEDVTLEFIRGLLAHLGIRAQHGARLAA